MSKTKRCRHCCKILVGESFRYSSDSGGGGPIIIYWCKVCGAIGRELCGSKRIVWERTINE